MTASLKILSKDLAPDFAQLVTVDGIYQWGPSPRIKTPLRLLVKLPYPSTGWAEVLLPLFPIGPSQRQLDQQRTSSGRPPTPYATAKAMSAIAGGLYILIVSNRLHTQTAILGFCWVLNRGTSGSP